MNDDLKKIIDENYNNNNDNNNFVDPNDLNAVLSHSAQQNINSTNIDNNVPNNANTQKESKKKKKLVSLPVLIFIIIGVIAIILILFSDFKDIKNGKKTPAASPSSNDNKTDNIKEENIEDSDIYGYAILSYIPDDDSWKEYYRIVELHIKEPDKTLASYDTNIKNAINQIRNININSVKIVNNKIYYQLYYNSSSNGITTYNNIMCIDLNDEEKKNYEVFNWKQDESNYKKTIKGYKVTYNYIYFSTNDPTLFYKYNINSKEVEDSTEEEFNKINEKTDSKYTRLNNLKNYYRGKEVYIENNNKLIYNGEAIYTSANSVLNLNYSFSDKIVFSEGTDCINISCDTIKYYYYDFTSNSKHELDFNNNQIFSQIVLYK